MFVTLCTMQKATHILFNIVFHSCTISRVYVKNIEIVFLLASCFVRTFLSFPISLNEYKDSSYNFIAGPVQRSGL